MKKAHLVGAEKINKENQNQNIGFAHCHYIRELAREIWTKENSNPSGNRIEWRDCLKRALDLHVKKLKINSNTTINKQKNI